MSLVMDHNDQLARPSIAALGLRLRYLYAAEDRGAAQRLGQNLNSWIKEGLLCSCMGYCLSQVQVDEATLRGEGCDVLVVLLSHHFTQHRACSSNALHSAMGRHRQGLLFVAIYLDECEISVFRFAELLCASGKHA